MLSENMKVFIAVAGLLGFSFFTARKALDIVLPSIKPGVDISNLSPVMNPALIAASKAAEATGAPNVITSGSEGVHMTGSKHYSNEAIDVRRADWPKFDNVALAQEQAKAIRSHLTDDFDVVLEAKHIHIEYDPHTKSAAIPTRGEAAA